MFKAPDFINQMLEKKLLGEKTKQGFYKKVKDDQGGKAILSLDYNTLEYTPQEKMKLASFEAAKNLASTYEKIKSLYYAGDTAGQFTFRTLTESLIYAANRIPEIADDIVNVDNALKWGFAREMGPFETWDAIGFGKSVAKMKEAGYEIPDWVKEMLDRGKESFYREEAGKRYFYDIATKDYQEVPVKPGIILLPSLK